MNEDDDPFREFVIARWASLVRTAFLLTGDHGRAEDLVQSTLERLHRNWRRIERKELPDAYARRIMINLAISNSRRRRFRETTLDHAPQTPSGVGVHGVEDRDEVWQLLLQLPPKMRAVLVLRYFEDLSEVEAARILGCSTGTIKSQSSRGLARMRDLMAATGDSAGPDQSQQPDATERSRR